MEKTAFRDKRDLHLSRKFWHFGGVLTLLVIYHNVTDWWAIGLAAALFLFIGPLDFLRQHNPKLNTFVTGLFRRVMRKEELGKVSGLTFLLLGALVTIAIFPRNVATLSLLLLAFADPLASLVGTQFGREKIFGEKTLQGALAAFFICTIVGGVFYFSKNLMTDRLVLVSLLTGIIGTISELIPIGRLDDNLTFPLLCSTLLWGLFSLFGAL